MRRRAFLSLALSSLTAQAATRPRYGGTLRVQLISMFATPETIPGVAETLVRYDEHGEYVPLVARGWQADSEKKRWRFIIRSKIVSTASIALTLGPVVKTWYGEAAAVTSTPQTVVI